MKGKYDAVVIGSGFGGSTVALELARTGRKVLIIERGRWADRDDSAWDPRAILIDRKYESKTPYEVDERWGRKLTYPDDTVGGKSVFYGAASLRLRQEDFRAADRFPSDELPKLPSMDWPIGYDDLAPHYDEAERLLDVAGVTGTDPNEPPRSAGYRTAPPPFGTSARRIAEAGKALGLSPFPIPLAINFHGNGSRPRCVMCTTCDLFPCKICAKNDLAVTVLPEAQRLGAEIRDRTIATKLVITHGRVTGVECVNVETGQRSTVNGELVVVSCGALASAALLLGSGLGNLEPNGRLVGKNLMRHCAGIAIAIFPFETNPERQFHKQVAFTDFYFGRPADEPRGPWGMIQALQAPPPEYIEQASPYPPPTGKIGAWTQRFQSFLLCIAEDVPQEANRVELDPTATDPYGMPIARVFHKYTKRDLRARKRLWREAGKVLRQAGALLRLRMPIHTYSHALGTCRMGTDPTTSVVDQWCRVWGVPNLFVVDGSTFPSSGGVNPSLTIAANGLRVAKHLAAR